MSETYNTKSHRIDLRVTPEQKELLEQAAAIKGVSLSAYSIFHLLPIAKHDVDSHQRLVLSDKDRDLFLSVLENPPPLKGKLKAAIQDYQHKYDQE